MRRSDKANKLHGSESVFPTSHGPALAAAGAAGQDLLGARDELQERLQALGRHGHCGFVRHSSAALETVITFVLDILIAAYTEMSSSS